jgi:nucleotide-binding universal stress UspA family protein
MLTIDHVLFPTDFSEGARQAFPQAAFLADWHDAELYILSVTGPIGMTSTRTVSAFQCPPRR